VRVQVRTSNKVGEVALEASEEGNKGNFEHCFRKFYCETCALHIPTSRKGQQSYQNKVFAQQTNLIYIVLAARNLKIIPNAIPRNTQNWNPYIGTTKPTDLSLKWDTPAKMCVWSLVRTILSWGRST
jgi:hypothetical protein